MLYGLLLKTSSNVGRPKSYVGWQELYGVYQAVATQLLFSVTFLEILLLTHGGRNVS